jgi:osmotically-inducible protein OsmY
MDRDQTRQQDQYQRDRFDEGESSRPSHAERAMTDPTRDRQQSVDRGTRAGGEWQGLVVPYRYYGPGYAGLGYYAVYYQGGEGREEEAEAPSSGFDQRNVRYGQGQGAGAAWHGDPGRSGQSGFAGRGPKGYRRSDERIREEINDRLTEHDELDASDIEVAVKDGEATLTGTVDSRWSKRLAEDLAERASGVRDVMNQLKVVDPYSNDPTRPGATPSRTSKGGTSTRGSTRPSNQSGSTRSQAGLGSQQPVGSGVGGATDGETGNGASQEPTGR